MKNYFIMLLGWLLAWAAPAQPPPPLPPRIKVVLVGTFHFGSTSDKKKTAFDDLFSPKRQAELQTFTQQLARLKPDKIFVENEPRRQPYWDSVLTLYQQKRLDTTGIRTEIFQVGARIANQAGVSQLLCVDHRQALPYDRLAAFNQRAEQDSVAQQKMANHKLLSLAYPYPRPTKQLASASLTEYYLYLNSPSADAGNRADYFIYSPAYGYEDDYTGVSMITSWYERNAKIFTNILRLAEPTDKVYIVLFGNSHLLPLRHYFQNCAYFEVVDLSSVVKP